MNETLDGPIHPDPHGVHRRSYGRAPTPRRRAPRLTWCWVLWLPLVFALGSVLLVGALRWWSPPVTAFMATAWVDARFTGAREFELRQRFVPLSAQTPWLAVAAIAAEDQKFPRHRGFDIDAMRAAFRDHQQGARLRGASTITQQLAKNLFLWSGRSWARKGLEAWFTVLLEALMPKRRIIEVYLNVAEFGPSTFGVEAAAKKYFRGSAKTLTAPQAALLAAVLPNPARLSAARPSAYVRSRQTWIIGQMRLLQARGHYRGLDW